jgi:hypothetical protein
MKKYRDLDRHCYVYLVGNKELNYYKVGISTQVGGRIKQFNVPFDVEIFQMAKFDNPWNALQVEQKLHQFYKGIGLHLRGEWFKSIPTSDFINRTKDLAKTCKTVDEGNRLTKYTTIIKDQVREKRVQKDVQAKRDRLLLQQLRTKGLV